MSLLGLFRKLDLGNIDLTVDFYDVFRAESGGNGRKAAETKIQT